MKNLIAVILITLIASMLMASMASINVIADENETNDTNDTNVTNEEPNETDLNETETNETEPNETDLNETETNETEANETDLNETEDVDKGKDFVKRAENAKKFLEQKTFRKELKAKIRECMTDPEAENCTITRQFVGEVAKGVVNKVCTNADTVIEKLKARVEKSRLSDEEKENLVKTIDAQAEELDKLCIRIEEANVTEIKNIVAEIKALFRETKIKINLARRAIQLRRVGLIVERAEHLETRLNKSLEKWTEAGCNETKLAELIDQFGSNIDEARAAYDESKDLWQQFIESIKNKKPDTELLQQAQEKMKLAQSKLKEAHSSLKKIIAELRACKETPEEPENETEPEEPENETEE